MTEQAVLVEIASPERFRLAPPFTCAESRLEFARCCEAFASALSDITEEDVPAVVSATQQRLVSGRSTWPQEDAAILMAALLVVADVLCQGWSIRVTNARVEVASPPGQALNPLADKDRIRRQELIKRNEQLLQEPVQEFVRSMEKRRLFGGRFVCIFDLMRDGRELAARMRSAQVDSVGPTTALDAVVEPYLQFVFSEEDNCEFTGLRLMDIWRYFRHTWANQYQSVPGRTMMFLVRDRAAANHPVIGIGAISSPVVQIRERDTWIGWHPSVFIQAIRDRPTLRIARWLVRIVDDALEELYVQDFYEGGLLTKARFKSPDEETIASLVQEGRDERANHHRFAQSKEYKQPKKAEAQWQQRARSHLFRSKRALALADLLRLRLALKTFFGNRPTPAKLRAMLEDPAGVRAVLRILRKAKADRVGILIGDISVCGAIQPYNSLLGGKLVAMLAASPDVVQAYGRRYAAAESEIASSMAGRAIVRKPVLAFLGTSSLYGASSQYNRIAIPCERLGGRKGDVIRYVERGRSETYGTSQFSGATVSALTDFVSQSASGLRVNSIFGEGQSPKLRKIRDGLEALDFPAARLLQHGRGRVVYCISLIRNLRDFLLGIDRRPEYLYSTAHPEQVTGSIVQWWKERWFRNRARSGDVLARIEDHTRVHPIRHGARVVLPRRRGALDSE